MFTLILVGLDGSPREAHVLAEAQTLARTHDAKLHLCRAMHVPLSIPAIAWSIQGDEFREFLLEHGRAALSHLAEKLPPELLHGTTCTIGNPAEVLYDVAKTIKADLIIVGSHGYDRIERVLGTTASRVTNTAPCSVLVLRSLEP